jgi:hypothetical protein
MQVTGGPSGLNDSMERAIIHGEDEFTATIHGVDVTDSLELSVACGALIATHLSGDGRQSPSITLPPGVETMCDIPDEAQNDDLESLFVDIIRDLTRAGGPVDCEMGSRDGSSSGTISEPDDIPVEIDVSEHQVLVPSEEDELIDIRDIVRYCIELGALAER